MSGSDEDSIAEALRSVIEEVKPDLESRVYESEATVRFEVIDPILEALGWKRRLIKVEYLLQGRRVDYALCPKGKQPYVIIEAKNLGKGEDADKQLFQYCFDAGAQLAVLSDGREWKFYYPPAVGEPSDRLAVCLDLVKTPLENCLKSFHRYLAFDEVRSGRAHENAKRDLDEERTRRDTEGQIPEAWKSLVNDKDKRLVDAVIERTSKLHEDGRAPHREDVIKFLKTLESSVSHAAIGASAGRTPSVSPRSSSPPFSAPSSATAKRPTPTPPRPPSSPSRFGQSLGKGRAPNRLYEFRVGDQWIRENRMSRAYVRVLEILLERPEAETFMRDQGWLASSEAGLSGKAIQAAEISGKGFVNTWTNTEQKIKQLKMICDAAGVSWRVEEGDRIILSLSGSDDSTPVAQPSVRMPTAPRTPSRRARYSFCVEGRWEHARDMAQVYVRVMSALVSKYTQAESFAAGKVWIARSEVGFNRRSVNLVRLTDKWFADTWNSSDRKMIRLKALCEAAGLPWDDERGVKIVERD